MSRYFDISLISLKRNLKTTFQDANVITFVRFAFIALHSCSHKTCWSPFVPLYTFYNLPPITTALRVIKKSPWYLSLIVRNSRIVEYTHTYTYRRTLPKALFGGFAKDKRRSLANGKLIRNTTNFLSIVSTRRCSHRKMLISSRPQVVINYALYFKRVLQFEFHKMRFLRNLFSAERNLTDKFVNFVNLNFFFFEKILQKTLYFIQHFHFITLYFLFLCLIDIFLLYDNLCFLLLILVVLYVST